MQKKLVILHLVNSKAFSGLESVACDIILNNTEFNHVYVTQDGPIIDILKEKNIKYEIIKKMSIAEIKRVIKKFNADLIHAHDFTASCMAALSFTNVTIISHLHHNAPWLKKINYKTLLYLVCSIRIKNILTVSEAVENDFIFSKFIKKKIICVYNPISVKKIQSQIDKNDYNKKYDICCVGRLVEAKNPLRWLDIINNINNLHPGIKAIWVGDGELKTEFMAKIKKLNLENVVEFIGFKKNPYKYIASSKVYLLTSSWEGFGLSAFEALSLGIPAVVTNVGGLPYIVDNASGSICNTDEELTFEVLKYLNDTTIYENGKKSALKKAKKIDNFEFYMKILKEIYKR